MKRLINWKEFAVLFVVIGGIYYLKKEAGGLSLTRFMK